MTDARRTALVLGLFATIALLVGVDLVTDLSAGVAPSHAIAEGVILLLATVGGVALFRELRALRRAAGALETRLVASQADADHWRTEAQELLAGLGVAIDGQFDRWKLTPAEREVGLLLLKGYSHKEIAGVRRVSDRTVRQQGRNIYQKAGLAGRAELAAFFLEDLLLPRKIEDGAAHSGGASSDPR